MDSCLQRPEKQNGIVTAIVLSKDVVLFRANSYRKKHKEHCVALQASQSVTKCKARSHHIPSEEPSRNLGLSKSQQIKLKADDYVTQQWSFVKDIFSNNNKKKNDSVSKSRAVM